jgi:hypothetical protein
LRTVDAGESPYGSGETGEAGAGTDVLEEIDAAVAISCRERSGW